MPMTLICQHNYPSFSKWSQVQEHIYCDLSTQDRIGPTVINYYLNRRFVWLKIRLNGLKMLAALAENLILMAGGSQLPITPAPGRSDTLAPIPTQRLLGFLRQGFSV